jgi:glycosyltransferase involved in cell wall biosynthesis
MRVAIVDPASFVLPYDLFLAQGLLVNGHTVELYCSNSSYNGELLDQAAVAFTRQADRFLVRRFDISRTVSPRRLVGVWNYLRMLGSLVRQRRRFDAVCLQFGIFLPLDLAFLWLMGRGVDLTVHDDVPHGFRGQRHWPTLLRCLSARRLVFTSEAVRRRFLNRYGLAFLERRTTLLQHGTLAASMAEGERSEATSQDGGRAVTFFGTVKPYKGVDVLLAAAPLLDGSRVEIYGRWDAQLRPLAASAREQGIRVVDEFLSNEELDRLLRQERVFVLPYRSASQSGVLYLLLHYARPFVSTDQGDLGAFLRKHDLADLIFDADRPADLVRCIRLVLSNYEVLAERMRSIRKSYDWAAIVGSHPMFQEA